MGKTTCAAALALRTARAGRRTLVISTDPAPSLGDAFRRPLTSVPRRISASLYAVEIDAARALERWLARRRAALERIAVRGTWLDEDDVAKLLRLSLPGIDEIAGLFEIARFGRAGTYDTIVVDTAPTGHTLRMLAMPQTLGAIARVFDHLQDKHRAMVEALRGAWTPEADDELIAEIARDADELSALLKDRGRVRMSWVTLPEPMAVAETVDAVAALAREQIPAQSLILNRVTPAPTRPCRYCDARRALEARARRTLERALGAARVAVVAARDAEPRGVQALVGIGAELESNRSPERVRTRSVSWRSPRPAGSPDVVSLLTTGGTRLLMFGGKGGVGKTTCAAAAAIELARRLPRRRVLLLSTDPAHSLGDVLGVALSDDARTVARGPKNLDVRELDAARRFRAVRERYAAAIDAMFERISRGSSLDIRYERVVMQDLFDLAPPGVDELAAVIDVMGTLRAADSSGARGLGGSGARELDSSGGRGLGHLRGASDREPRYGAQEGSYDLIVMDTAPSGHALRLLEMPALVQDWTRALMSILLKYQAIGGIGELGPLLLALSQGLGRLRALLEDPRRTRFVAVTRAAALPRAETLRLVRRLGRMHIHVGAVVVNATGRGTCDRCRRAMAAERREIAALARSIRGRRALPIVLAPAELPPPHGTAALGHWVRTWRQLP